MSNNDTNIDAAIDRQGSHLQRQQTVKNIEHEHLYRCETVKYVEIKINEHIFLNYCLNCVQDKNLDDQSKFKFILRHSLLMLDKCNLNVLLCDQCRHSLAKHHFIDECDDCYGFFVKVYSTKFNNGQVIFNTR
ncbi:HESP097 [Hemileuca sp. nucleopolyhedrovirus]|uniref:HESP097 n=1 Tax=Hemileuca sp. nucleopolyhedrovirus TaxID=1367203 RepID=S5MQG7_9ABAC|nr:HESP097 [Hemileuca sp. nucleopolyhedrovirus]AGR56849.1 HESP097 [Hemileuca sp. nucleopolyhedrovirus]